MDFKHRMICDRAIDDAKCRAFLVILTGFARVIYAFNKIHPDLRRGYGHETQDCYDLKNVIEQTIKNGNSKFGKGEIPEAENSESQNERDKDEEPTTVINVITDSSAVDKSKYVLEKDLKILNMIANTA
ncbi:hypothetical protein PIB30_042938 [Stylosanthes scabra]|uniref:Uncharacterized protein n=1 Tax=Stylosanthes scabra TaxID=79078 RepID=A0ABU6XFP8_9FABA|nr:hypothetical protein [Stylosanthes scabra]